MEKIKSVLLVSALSVLFTGSAFADGQTGQLTFNGVVDAGTCVLSGQDISRDLGPITKTGSWVTTPGGLFHSQNLDIIKVSDCSAAVKNVIVTTAFTPYNATYYGYVKNDGSATGLSVQLSKTASNFILANTFAPAQPQTFAIDPVAKGVDIPVYSNYEHIHTDAVSSGSLQFNATFQFAYE